jgi:hypothetical protein
LPDRFPGLAALGNLAPFFQAKVLIYRPIATSPTEGVALRF